MIRDTNEMLKARAAEGRGGENPKQILEREREQPRKNQDIHVRFSG